MKVAGRSSEQNLLMPSGKRSMKNGPRDHQRNFPSGSVRGQARKLEMPKPQKERKKVAKKPLQKRNLMKKRRRKKKKQYSQKPKQPLICLPKPKTVCLLSLWMKTFAFRFHVFGLGLTYVLNLDFERKNNKN